MRRLKPGICGYSAYVCEGVSAPLLPESLCSDNRTSPPSTTSDDGMSCFVYNFYSIPVYVNSWVDRIDDQVIDMTLPAGFVDACNSNSAFDYFIQHPPAYSPMQLDPCPTPAPTDANPMPWPYAPKGSGTPSSIDPLTQLPECGFSLNIVNPNPTPPTYKEFDPSTNAPQVLPINPALVRMTALEAGLDKALDHNCDTKRYADEHELPYLELGFSYSHELDDILANVCLGAHKMFEDGKTHRVLVGSERFVRLFFKMLSGVAIFNGIRMPIDPYPNDPDKDCDTYDLFAYFYEKPLFIGFYIHANYNEGDRTATLHFSLNKEKENKYDPATLFCGITVTDNKTETIIDEKTQEKSTLITRVIRTTCNQCYGSTPVLNSLAQLTNYISSTFPVTGNVHGGNSGKAITLPNCEDQLYIELESDSPNLLQLDSDYPLLWLDAKNKEQYYSGFKPIKFHFVGGKLPINGGYVTIPNAPEGSNRNYYTFGGTDWDPGNDTTCVLYAHITWETPTTQVNATSDPPVLDVAKVEVNFISEKETAEEVVVNLASITRHCSTSSTLLDKNHTKYGDSPIKTRLFKIQSSHCDQITSIFTDLDLITDKDKDDNYSIATLGPNARLLASPPTDAIKYTTMAYVHKDNSDSRPGPRAGDPEDPESECFVIKVLDGPLIQFKDQQTIHKANLYGGKFGDNIKVMCTGCPAMPYNYGTVSVPDSEEVLFGGLDEDIFLGFYVHVRQAVAASTTVPNATTPTAYIDNIYALQEGEVMCKLVAYITRINATYTYRQ